MKNATLAEKRLGFRIHAIAFVAVILMLLIVNALTGPPYWVVWVIPGWGVGLICHWFFVLGPGAGRSGAT